MIYTSSGRWNSFRNHPGPPEESLSVPHQMESSPGASNMGFPREPAGFYEVSKIAIDDHDLSNDFYIFSD